MSIQTTCSVHWSTKATSKQTAMVYDAMSRSPTQTLRPRYKTLPYRIHSYSSYSKEFAPSRIIPCRPEDHTSRWSCQTGDTAPWVMLELTKPAVLDEIKIGRYQDEHPCNAQSITILAGNSPTNLQQILHVNLKNEGGNEFCSLQHNTPVWTGNMDKVNPWDIRHEKTTVPCPVRYIKILPGRAYEPRYNVSIWHIKLEGISEELYMKKVQEEWHNSQRLHQDRMILKHLRYSRDLRPAFDQMLSLTQQTHGIATVLEHPLITELFDTLVLQRSYSASEATMQRICEEGMMQECPALAVKGYTWKTIGDESLERPSARGGHAICAYDGTYWLFGGYDGRSDIDDFWRGFLDGDVLSWNRIQRDSEPCPDFRSRYRMVATDSHVYMIGVAGPDEAGIPVNESFGLITQDLVDLVSSTDASSRADTTVDVPLWEYEIASNRWRQLPALNLSSACETVTSIEWKSGRLFIGKINHYMHSFAMFDINENRWTQFDRDESTMLSRYDGKSSDYLHAECFDFLGDRHVILSPSARGILGGQALDIERIPIPNELVTGTFSARLFASSDGLSLTLVAGNHEECIIPSAEKKTSIYTFSIVRGEWKQLEMIDALHPDLPETPTGHVHFNEVTKCGHEFVYDRVSGRSIFFGGRTDSSATMKENVAVELVLYGVTEHDLLRKCRRVIRRQAFLDILHLGSSLEALQYLQTALSAVTDPLDMEEQRDLKALFTMLLRHREKQTEATDNKDTSLLEAFAEIVSYVSARYKEPNGEIVCNM